MSIVASGCWLLVAGCGLLVKGQLLVARCWLLLERRRTGLKPKPWDRRRIAKLFPFFFNIVGKGENLFTQAVVGIDKLL
jgi:hypothetical protein